MGCVVLLAVGCTGMGTEANKQEQGRSPEPTASEEARCAGTRTVDLLKSAGVSTVSDSSVQPGDPEALTITNDLPGCPNGGLLSGSDEADKLTGEDGEDEVRGLGAADMLSGGRGRDVVYGGPGDDELQGGGWLTSPPYTDRSKNTLYGGPGKDWLAGTEGDDVLYGGDGDDKMLWGGEGEDVLYGEDGNDYFDAVEGTVKRPFRDTQRDELYCGKGTDEYVAGRLDYVASSCEVKK